TGAARIAGCIAAIARIARIPISRRKAEAGRAIAVPIEAGICEAGVHAYANGAGRKALVTEARLPQRGAGPGSRTQMYLGADMRTARAHAGVPSLPGSLHVAGLHVAGKTPEPRHSEVFPEVPIEERASAPSAERALTELTVTLQSIPEKLR